MLHSRTRPPRPGERAIKTMKPKFDLIGTACGVLGAGVCVLAVILRFIGKNDPAFMTMNPFHLFMGGATIIVFGCWCKLMAK